MTPEKLEILISALEEFIFVRTSPSLESYIDRRYRGYEPWLKDEKLKDVNKQIILAQSMLKEYYK
jgi:hypothetical protein